MVKPRIKRYGGKNYRLYVERAASPGYVREIEETAAKLKRRGWYYRIEYSVWGNVRLWIRKRK